MAGPFVPTTDPAVYELQNRVLALENYNANLLRYIQTNLAAIARANPYAIERSGVPLTLQSPEILGNPSP